MWLITYKPDASIEHRQIHLQDALDWINSHILPQITTLKADDKITPNELHLLSSFFKRNKAVGEVRMLAGNKMASIYEVITIERIPHRKVMDFNTGAKTYIILEKSNAVKAF